MRRVLQTVLTTPVDGVYTPGDTGNCLQAALASILDVDVHQVPHVVDYPDGYDDATDPLFEEHGPLWYRACRLWLRAGGPDGTPRDLYGCDDVPQAVAYVATRPPFVASPLLLGGVTSPRGGFSHAVVVDEHGTIVWDPHPGQDAYRLPVNDVSMITVPYDTPVPPPDPWADTLLTRTRTAA